MRIPKEKLIYDYLKELGAPIYKTPKKPNYMRMPVFIVEPSHNSTVIFNNLIGLCKANGFNTLVQTRSRGISIACENFRPPAFMIKTSNSCFEITIVCSFMIRFQFRKNFTTEVKENISGSKAFYEFRRICDKFGINLREYAIENGYEVKKTIPKPKTDLAWRIDPHENRIYNHAYHIDLNSAYMASLAEAYPEFREPVNYFYTRRKEKPVYKAVLTHTFGYFQSDAAGMNYRYAHLAKACMEGTIKKLEELEKRLLAAGREILFFNVDGIWYRGEEYHDENEGTELGQWKTDHRDCHILIKGPRSYIYKENGVFHTALSGRSGYELEKPREQWNFIDFNRAINRGYTPIYRYNTNTDQIEEFNEGVYSLYV